MDLRQSKEYGKFLKKIGWSVEVINNRQYFVKTIPLLGAAIKLQRVNSFSFVDINKLCKKYRVFQIILEPIILNSKNKLLLIKNGFKLSGSPYLPTKTSKIDISINKEGILSNMKKDARYSIRKSQTLRVYKTQNIMDFRKAWKEAVGNNRHVLPVHELKAFKAAFGKNMLLILNKSHTSGAMFLVSNNTCYYWVGFTNEFARKSLIQYQIMWHGILWAKTKKVKVFDFEGIYDERFPKEEWKGFTHFKKSFGGKEVKYPGCFIKWRLPL